MASNNIRYTIYNVNGSKYFRKFIENPLEQRKKVADDIIAKFPDRVPVLIDKTPKSNLPDIDKRKFLVPNDITVGTFLFEIRKHIQLNQEQAMFLFVNNTLPPPSTLMSALYQTHKNEDNFLYICYAGENVFG